jgi:hypothetical protein
MIKWISTQAILEIFPLFYTPALQASVKEIVKQNFLPSKLLSFFHYFCLTTFFCSSHLQFLLFNNVSVLLCLSIWVDDSLSVPSVFCKCTLLIYECKLLKDKKTYFFAFSNCRISPLTFADSVCRRVALIYPKYSQMPNVFREWGPFQHSCLSLLQYSEPISHSVGLSAGVSFFSSVSATMSLLNLPEISGWGPSLYPGIKTGVRSETIWIKEHC